MTPLGARMTTGFPMPGPDRMFRMSLAETPTTFRKSGPTARPSAKSGRAVAAPATVIATSIV
ncbi:hypothetical protein [uncultured Marivita sp.]|jgi:hypothetical protein|uniref:hypothetical protein n=1 Tax=Marivita sp. TaxID=2003365 RepID=UPI0025E25D12|nr:hypothetical protein [uncultured Marivita sp.]MCR9107386.1 hypothetical protein [Paracoccaceae bacterium]